MSTREAVLARVEAFIASRGISPRQFSIKAVGDHRFVGRLRSGKGVTLTVIERAEKFMDEASNDAAPVSAEAA